MDTKLLKHFMVTVDCGSISKAAERLNVVQPALSQQIAVLEQQLGRQILERSSRGVRATQAGLVLYQRAKSILAEVDGLHYAIHLEETEPAGPVAVGFPTSMASLLATPLLEQVIAQYPAIRLQIFESMSGYVADRVSGGQLDLAMLFRDASTAGLDVLPLMDEGLCVVGNRPLRDLEPGAPCPIEDLENVPLLLPSNAQGLRVLVERAFLRADVALNVVADVDCLPALVGAARRGVAHAVLARSALIAHGGEEGVFIWPLGQPQILRPVSLCWSPSLPRTAASIAVHKLVVEIARAFMRDNPASGLIPRPSSGAL